MAYSEMNKVVNFNEIVLKIHVCVFKKKKKIKGNYQIEMCH